MYPDTTSNTPGSFESRCSTPQKQPPAKIAVSVRSFFAAGTNSSDTELTQWRVFRGVKPSPVKTWPRWPPHRAQVISVRRPSASTVRFTAPGISSSKLGQPHPASNLSDERYNGAPHCRQT